MMGFLADLVVVVHFAFVCFVAVGAFLLLRWPRLAWVHLPCAAWGAVIELTGVICPLTPLEKWLRLQAGRASYEGGFIQHYIVGLIYPEGLTREMQLGLAVLVVVGIATIYALVRRRARPPAHRRARRSGGEAEAPTPSPAAPPRR